jgi:mRNA degradation ribonuclease J1/J2
VGEPEIVTRGFIFARNGDDLFASTSQLINDAVNCGAGNVQSDLEETIKSYLFNKTRRRPMVFVTVSRV